MDTVHPFEHHPLVALQIGDLLILRGDLVVRELEAFRDLRDGRVERLAVHLAEEALAVRPAARDGSEARDALRIVRIHEVRRLAGGGRGAGAEGVVGVAHAAERALVDEGHRLERHVGAVLRRAKDVDRFVEERLLPVDGEPHAHAEGRLVLGGARVPGQDDVRVREEGREIARQAHAA